MKAANLTDNACIMNTHKYSDDKVRSLLVFPFIDDNMIEALFKEKEEFCIGATDTHVGCGHIAFWDQ